MGATTPDESKRFPSRGASGDGQVPPPGGYFEPIPEQPRKISVGSTVSEDSLHLPNDGPVEELMQDRIEKEQSLGEEEEKEEMMMAEHQQAGPLAALNLGREISATTADPVVGSGGEGANAPSDRNALAALREPSDGDELAEGHVPPNASERRRMRRELLAEKLKVVFGLDEREEVLEEMRCWLLRSVSE